MTKEKKPHFIIKKNLQKSNNTGKYFSDDLTDSVLTNVCRKLTNKDEYTVQFVDNDYKDKFYEKGYNKGRMAVLIYNDCVNYISFSEAEINGRNSSVQSVPTAFNLFYNSKIKNKNLYYYFLKSKGNLETDYHLFMYRLMSTIGFKFINDDEVLSSKIIPFNSIDDIIYTRKSNKGKNRSNNSTYVTKSGKLAVDIYGKTYGASKYESAMICYAVSMLADKQTVILYEVLEQNLKELPKKTREIIDKMNVIDIIPTDMKFEKTVFNQNNSLRSPRYLYNLFNKFGEKKCAFCECIIPEAIQGAHIWPVAEIKKFKVSDFDKKLAWAIDGDNGLWLCNNHHVWFDKNIIRISLEGDILINDNIGVDEKEFIKKNTTVKMLPKTYLTPKFINYVKKRYNSD